MLFFEPFRNQVIKEIEWWQKNPRAKILLKEISKKETLLRNALISDAPFISEKRVNLDHLQEVMLWLDSFKEMTPPNEDDEEIELTPQQKEEVLPYIFNEDGIFTLKFNDFNDLKFNINKTELGSSEYKSGLKDINPNEEINLNKILKIEDFSDSKLEIGYVNKETKTRHRAIPRYSFIGNKIELFNPTKISKINEYFDINSENRTVLLKKNKQIEIKHNLIIPSGYKLIMKEGSSIYFQRNAGLIIKGELLIEGSSQFPVIINGVNNGQDSWAGVLVLAQGNPVYINNLIMKGGSGIFDNFKFRGAFTISNSEVEILNSSFSSNQSEDTLNLVQVRGLLDNIKIFNTPSDGLDIDFGDIIVNNVTFENIGKNTGADAIDMSKSIVKIKDSTIINVTDKGVSVGEASICEIENIRISDVLVGLTSKDSSKLTVNSAHLSNIGLSSAMAYRKKSQHNGASLVIKDINTTNENYISQENSFMLINNHLIKNKKVNVDKLYEEIMFSLK